MTTLYLSGPIRGCDDFKETFKAAEEKLHSAGYSVINPCSVGTLGEEHVSTWARNMRADIMYLVQCDGVAYLPGWQHSTGAATEIELAVKLEMPAMSVEDWLL